MVIRRQASLGHVCVGGFTSNACPGWHPSSTQVVCVYSCNKVACAGNLTVLFNNLPHPNTLTLGLQLQAFEDGFSQEDIFEYTKIDPWFVAQFWEMHQAESWLKTQELGDISAFDMLQAKKRGFSDSQIARFTGVLSLYALSVLPCMGALSS